MAHHPDDQGRSGEEHITLASDALRGVYGLLMDVSSTGGAMLEFTRPRELMAVIELIAMEFDRAAEAARVERRSSAA